MYKLICLILISLILTSCALIPTQRPNIEQGNIITPEMVQHLHKGMSMERVKDMMGTPTLVNTFNDNRIDYVYTFQAGHGDRRIKEHVVTLTFSGGALRDIKENWYQQ